MPYSPTTGLDPTLIRVGINGGVVVAPLGTAFPSTDLMGTWTTGFTTLGTLSDAGMTETRNGERQNFMSWQFAGIVRSSQSSVEETFTFEGIESNAKVISLYYEVEESAMTVGGAGANLGVVSFNTGSRPAPMRRAFGLDVVDGTARRRMFIPQGEITQRGDLTYVTNDMVKYSFTLTAYPTSSGVSVQRHHLEGWTPTA